MAFQLGEIKISGTIDDHSFYNSVFGWLVRRKGGPTRKQFKNSSAFARARENSNEFTLCSKVASAIRKLIISHTNPEPEILKPETPYHRLVKLMRLLANADQTSARGQRDPLKGINTTQGKLLLKDFQITTGISLYDLLISVGYIKKTERENSPFEGERPTKSLTGGCFRKPHIFRSLPLNLHPFSASYNKHRKYEKTYTTSSALTAYKTRGPTNGS